MKILELSIDACEPLVITSGSAESMAHSCLDYIPGSMILGAFAAAWIHDNPGRNPDISREFQKLFLDGEVSWGCAYPVCGELRCVPVPLCFMREKNLPGLPVENRSFKKKDFTIFNPLALSKGDEDGLKKLYEEKFGNEGPIPKFKKLSATFMNPRTYWQPDIRKLWNIRVALGRQRSALEGQLFGFSALAPGTRFIARIFCGDESVSALGKLLATHKTARLGHARSSGYGLVSIAARWENMGDETRLSGTSFNIFLESPYLPMPLWDAAPLNMLRALEGIAGQKAHLDATYLSHIQVEGFNGHWRKWRESRPALSAGGILRLTFANTVQLPSTMVLGSCALEGYGRIMVDPPFLKTALPNIQGMPPREKESKPSKILPNGPVWRILRARAISRYAAEQARIWLAEDKWTKFLNKAASLNRPTANQRANVMHMDLETFKEMLEKTPGRQWKDAVCPNPFGGGQDSLASIMQVMLEPAAFLKQFPALKLADLPGGEPSQEERQQLDRKAHELFKRELIRAWNKYSRIGKNGGGEDRCES